MNPESNKKENKPISVKEMTDFILSYGDLSLHLTSRVQNCHWGTFKGLVYPHNLTNISSLSWSTQDEVIGEIYSQLKYFENKIKSKEITPLVMINLTANDLYVISKALFCQKSPDHYSFPDKCLKYLNTQEGEKLFKKLQRLLKETAFKFTKTDKTDNGCIGE
jgi:hypothetical protein